MIIIGQSVDPGPESLCHCGTVKQAIEIAAENLKKSHAHDQCAVWMLQIGMSYALIARAYMRKAELSDLPSVVQNDYIKAANRRIQAEIDPLLDEIINDLKKVSEA